jgi:beta-xylosidase
MILQSIGSFAQTALLFTSLAAAELPNTFYNPILPGFHPDPSCIHVPEDETTYCATSSFSVFPGIPIHASKNLRDWKLVGKYSKYPRVLPVPSNITP